MKNSIFAVAAVLLTASTITLADDAIVANDSIDSLGLPSSALLLTEEASSETRGQRWEQLKQARAAYDLVDAEWDCDSWPQDGAASFDCIEAAGDVSTAKAKFQRAKAKDTDEVTGGTDHTAYWRAKSY